MKIGHMKRMHMLLCALLLVGGVALVASGVGSLAFLPLVLCGLMMGAMMWLMMGSGRNRRDDFPDAT